MKVREIYQLNQNSDYDNNQKTKYTPKKSKPKSIVKKSKPKKPKPKKKTNKKQKKKVADEADSSSHMMTTILTTRMFIM